MESDFEKICKGLGIKETSNNVRMLLTVVKGRKVECILNQNYENAANYRMIERDLLELQEIEDIDPLERMQEDDSEN